MRQEPSTCVLKVIIMIVGYLESVNGTLELQWSPSSSVTAPLCVSPPPCGSLLLSLTPDMDGASKIRALKAMCLESVVHTVHIVLDSYLDTDQTQIGPCQSGMNVSPARTN